MAANFKISLQSNSKDIHMKLQGDFDGSSACELINTMKSHWSKFEKIIIHTCGLSSVHPFGLNVFQRDYGMFRKLSNKIIVTGKYQKTIVPSERCMI